MVGKKGGDVGETQIGTEAREGEVDLKEWARREIGGGESSAGEGGLSFLTGSGRRQKFIRGRPSRRHMTQVWLHRLSGDLMISRLI